MAVTPVNQSKHTATASNQTKMPGTAVVAGNPIGLLLALTYNRFIGVVPANQTRNTVTPTNQTKH